MYRIAQTVHLLALSLLVGFMAVVQWSLVPAQNRLSATGYAVLEQGMNRMLTVLTPTLMISALVAGLLASWFGRRHRPRVITAIGLLALGCLVVMIISTLVINAPVNTAIDTWNAQQPPANWMELRDRWEFGHAIRTYVGLLGLLAAIVSTVCTDLQRKDRSWQNRS